MPQGYGQDPSGEYPFEWERHKYWAWRRQSRLFGHYWVSPIDAIFLLTLIWEFRTKSLCKWSTSRWQGAHRLSRDINFGVYFCSVIDTINDPYSLKNWKKEFHKWWVCALYCLWNSLQTVKYIRLGKDRVGVFTGDKDKSVVKQFINSYVIPTLFGLCTDQNYKENTPSTCNRLWKIAYCHVRRFHLTCQWRFDYNHANHSEELKFCMYVLFRCWCPGLTDCTRAGPP